MAAAGGLEAPMPLLTELDAVLLEGLAINRPLLSELCEAPGRDSWGACSRPKERCSSLATVLYTKCVENNVFQRAANPG